MTSMLQDGDCRLWGLRIYTVPLSCSYSGEWGGLLVCSWFNWVGGKGGDVVLSRDWEERGYVGMALLVRHGGNKNGGGGNNRIPPFFLFG